METKMTLAQDEGPGPTPTFDITLGHSARHSQGLLRLRAGIEISGTTEATLTARPTSAFSPAQAGDFTAIRASI
jgi:hypothetical protein